MAVISILGEITSFSNPGICPKCQYKRTNANPFCERCGFDLPFGTVGNRQRGKCIYCKKAGKLTEEHVFGDWLNKKYPYRARRHSQILSRPTGNPALFKLGARPNFHARQVPLNGRPYDLKTYNVCQDCNNGWMSDVHNKARNIVISLGDGKWPDLSKDENDSLARWAIMVSINFQCFSRILFCPQHQRTTLMQGGIPEGWRVSIGLMKTRESAGFHHVRSIKIPMASQYWGDLMPFTSSYFCVEKLAVHAFNGPSGIGTLSLALLFCGADAPIPLEQIWPTCIRSTEARASNLTWQNLDLIQKRFD